MFKKLVKRYKAWRTWNDLNTMKWWRRLMVLFRIPPYDHTWFEEFVAVDRDITKRWAEEARYERERRRSWP